MIGPAPADRTNRDAGFTLAEVLVVLVIASLMSVMILGVLTLQARAEGSLRTRVTDGDAVVRVQSLLRARMETMRAFPDIHGVGDWVTFEGRPGLLQFDAPALQNDGPHALYHYRLQLDRSGNLLLLDLNSRSPIDWRILTNKGWNAMTLLSGASRIQLTYFGPDRFTGKDAWQENWIRRRSLPKLISIRVIFPSGDLRRWPVFMVRPSTQTRLPCHQDNFGKDCGDPT